MNGFSNDVFSILRHNVMLHRSSIGLVVGGDEIPNAYVLLKELQLNDYLAVGQLDKTVRYDYIVISRVSLNIRKFLSCLTSLASGGLMILEITGSDNKYEDKYLNMVGGTMSATKLRYGDRSYIVIHTGEDYGD